MKDMNICTIEECFYQIRNGVNIKQGTEDGGYPITRIETTANDKFNRDRMGYAGITDLEKYKSYVLEDGDLLMSHINSVQYLGRTVLYKKQGKEKIIHGMNLLVLKAKRNIIRPAYARYYFYSRPFREQIGRITKKSVNQASFAVADLKKIKICIPDLSIQDRVIDILDLVNQIIEERQQELLQLDDLIKVRFIEMFGDLKKNDKGWKILRFSDFAKIDTKMIHDFEEYQDYPHIGIDSIEKGTGKICGYRTVKEDAVASGKYIFTPEHIIYSKIRPNLNKVALPDFIGVCSADAYPILPIKGKCNRTYLAYVMRDKVFLDYILAFSNRTNLPKVNKKQVEGFSCPIPELNLQKRFEDFVKQVDKSKVSIQKALDETKLLFDSLMQKYFG